MPTGSTDMQTPEDGTAVDIDPAEVQAFIQNTINPVRTPASTAAMTSLS